MRRHDPPVIRKRFSIRAAFTLLELIVAIALSAVVLLGARLMLVQLADGAGAVAQASIQADRDANGDRLLRALLGQVEVGADEKRWFRGDERVMRFTTWCDVPAGWPERCDSTLRIDAPTSVLRAELSADGATETVTLRTTDSAIGFRYLEDATGGGSWLQTWKRAMEAPIAVGIVLERDTIIVRVGARG